jgi:hypothetical protein
MSYRHFSLACRCGQSPSRIEEVGVTDDHELVIHWWCDQCQKLVYASKTMADCWPAVPAPPPGEMADYDKRFLERVGISSR